MNLHKLIHVAHLIDTQDTTKEEKIEAVQECASTPIESSESCEEIQFNPNVLTEFKLAGSQEVCL